MRAYLFSCVALLALAGCAVHPSRCGGRLTPINRQPDRSDVIASPRRVVAQPLKAVHG